MASKQQQGEQPFDFDIGRLMDGFRVPGLDIGQMVEGQRRNVEALTQANRVAYEGFQAVMARQAEILRQAVEEAVQASQDMAEPGTPQDKAAKQAELAKDAFERGLSNMREISEMMARSGAEAVELLNKRFAQAMDEMRDGMLRAK